MEQIIKHCRLSKPLVLRNFVNWCDGNDTGAKLLLGDIINDREVITERAYAKCKIMRNVTPCLKNLYDFLKSHKDVIVDEPEENAIRVWHHQPPNLTQYHYDGNGVNVINVCLNGRKQFRMMKPNTHTCIPFTNISIDRNISDEEVYEIGKGDLLLIPAFWYHEVLTLAPDTITLNYEIILKDFPIDKKNLLKFKMHNMLDTHMMSEPVMKVVDNKFTIADGPSYIDEIIPYVILCMMLYIFKDLYNIDYLACIVFLILIVSLAKDTDTFGMSTVSAFNMSLVFAIMYFIVKYQKKL